MWLVSPQLSCVMSEGKGSHSISNDGKGRMLRLRHSSSNSLRVGLTKLNLLVGWLVYVWVVFRILNTISSQSEKKQKAWYYASMYPSYKTRKSEFKSLFSDCHRFKFVVDYSCAYHKVNQLVRST